MPSRNFNCVKQQSLAQFNGSNNQGNGKDGHAPVGLYSIGLYRDLQQFALNWTGVFQIQKAKLWEYTSGQIHVAFGGSPRITIRRIDGPWSEAGGSEGNWSSSPNTTYPGPSTVGASIDSAVLPGAQSKWTSTDITDIVEEWAPATVKRRDGSPGGAATNRGIRLISFDEGSASRTTEFNSSRQVPSSRPYVELTYNNDSPPNPPTITSPVGSTTPEVIGTASGTEDTTTYLFSDPDAGDTNALVQVQYFGAGATDGAPGTAVKDPGPVAPVGAGALNKFTVKVLNLPARTAMRKRLRTQDNRGAWGAWTPLAEGYVKTAYRPGIPANHSMGTDPDGPPHIFGTLDSPDTGDYVTGWEGNFYRDTPLGRITLWASGVVDIGGTSTRSDVTYAGTALNDADVVKWTHRHRNRDGVWGPFSPEYTTKMHTLVGPQITPSSNATKLLSRTAQLTITFDTSCDGYQWRLYRGGALIYDSGLTAITAAASVNVNIPAGIANWCDDLEIEAAERPAGGALGAFSPRSTLHIDCLPSTTLTLDPPGTLALVEVLP